MSKTTSEPTPNPPPTFEAGLQQLESIVKEMETGELPLERALELVRAGHEAERSLPQATGRGGNARRNPDSPRGRSSAPAVQSTDEKMTLPEYIAHQQKRVDAALDRWVPPNRRTLPSSIAPCATACSRAANAFVPCWRWPRPKPFSDAPARHRSRGLRAGADPHLLADPRRPARPRQRRSPPRPSHLPQSVRRRDGDSGGRCAADAGVRGAVEARPDVDAERRIRLVRELATASGTVGGMIGGQVNDIEGEGKHPTAALLESIHRAKTGALLRASVRMGAIYARRRRRPSSPR